MQTNNIEIEKKYQLKYLPKKFELIDKYEIKQYYLIWANKGSNARIRIIDNHKFIQTVKETDNISGTKSKNEKEIEVSKHQAKELLKFFGVNNMKPVKKTRLVINLGPKYNNLKAEVDIFGGRLKGKRFVEVEFANPAEMVNFVKPRRFGKELNISNKDLFKKINKLQNNAIL